MPELEYSVSKRMIPAKIGGRSLVAIGGEPPFKFGNYFDFNCGGDTLQEVMSLSVRCVNMWAENLEEWAKRNKAGEIECVVVSTGEGSLGAVVDPRVGEEWYIHKDNGGRDICLTGAGHVPRALIEELARHSKADAAPFICGCEDPDQPPGIISTYAFQESSKGCKMHARCRHCGREWDHNG